MASAKLYAPSGQQKGTVELPDWAFASPIHRHAMWEAVRSFLANQRQGTSMVKNRKLVSGGGRKPWAQKKTGRARAGTTRSPIWVGGARAFGPRPRSYNYDLPRKVRRLALRSALSLKAREEQVAVLSELPVTQVKTKEVFSVLKNLGLTGSKTLLVLPDRDPNVLRAARNIPKLQTEEFRNLNTYQVLRSDRLLFLESAVTRMWDIEVKE